jgi:L-fuculose-phosphate aldolase
MQTYETMQVDWDYGAADLSRDQSVIDEFLTYAAYLCKRGLITNTFGNMVIRVCHPDHALGVLYTKRRGLSLEECGREDVVVTTVETNRLLSGTSPPSTGHQMSREIMRHRPDANAVVHTHPHHVCAYFASDRTRKQLYVGNDTALVLGAAPKILPRHINLEADPEAVKDHVSSATAFVMPNHGLVTIGRTLSEAYHRHTALIGEVQRLILTQLMYPGDGSCYLPEEEVKTLYPAGDRIIYGIEN